MVYVLYNLKWSSWDSSQWPLAERRVQQPPTQGNSFELKVKFLFIALFHIFSFFAQGLEITDVTFVWRIRRRFSSPTTLSRDADVHDVVVVVVNVAFVVQIISCLSIQIDKKTIMQKN